MADPTLHAQATLHARVKVMRMRQAAQFRRYQLFASAFSQWKRVLLNRCIADDKDCVAMLFWSLRLKQKVIIAWASHHRKLRSEAHAREEALDRRRQWLVKSAVEHWFAASSAMSLHTSTVTLAREQQHAVRLHLRVRRLAERWRRRACRGGGVDSGPKGRRGMVRTAAVEMLSEGQSHTRDDGPALPLPLHDPVPAAAPNGGINAHTFVGARAVPFEHGAAAVIPGNAACAASADSAYKADNVDGVRRGGGVGGRGAVPASMHLTRPGRELFELSALRARTRPPPRRPRELLLDMECHREREPEVRVPLSAAPAARWNESIGGVSYDAAAAVGNGDEEVAAVPLDGTGAGGDGANGLFDDGSCVDNGSSCSGGDVGSDDGITVQNGGVEGTDLTPSPRLPPAPPMPSPTAGAAFESSSSPPPTALSVLHPLQQESRAAFQLDTIQAALDAYAKAKAEQQRIANQIILLAHTASAAMNALVQRKHVVDAQAAECRRMAVQAQQELKQLLGNTLQ